MKSCSALQERVYAWSPQVLALRSALKGVGVHHMHSSHYADM